MNKAFSIFALLFAFVTSFTVCHAQQITGAWKGTINNQKVELKIIQKGDSLTGTSYYYGLTVSHKRYSINELVMVAENLGSIPPNTALMIAMIAGKRYEAYLESTEGSSSLIRFTQKK